MREVLDRAMELWSEPIPDGDAGVARFATVYADPVSVNGQDVPLSTLVDRARVMSAVVSDRSTEVHDVVEGPGYLAAAFAIRARHTGPWTAPDGTVRPATGQEVVVQGLDIFRFDADGRVRTIWAVNDLGDALTRIPEPERGQSSPR
jgi:hypothetical protein